MWYFREKSLNPRISLGKLQLKEQNILNEGHFLNILHLCFLGVHNFFSWGQIRGRDRTMFWWFTLWVTHGNKINVPASFILCYSNISSTVNVGWSRQPKRVIEGHLKCRKGPIFKFWDILRAKALNLKINLDKLQLVEQNILNEGHFTPLFLCNTKNFQLRPNWKMR